MKVVKMKVRIDILLYQYNKILLLEQYMETLKNLVMSVVHKRMVLIHLVSMYKYRWLPPNLHRYN